MAVFESFILVTRELELINVLIEQLYRAVTLVH